MDFFCFISSISIIQLRIVNPCIAATTQNAAPSGLLSFVFRARISHTYSVKNIIKKFKHTIWVSYFSSANLTISSILINLFIKPASISGGTRSDL
jgi:hypothetical protein